MAVLLYREGERKSQALPPDLRSLPQVTVRNQPVIAAPQWSGQLRARTPIHVSYTRPEREQVWREKFERRQVQQTACGFHGPAYRPYRDVGQVELDDPSLILGGLGQKQDGQVHLRVPSSSPLSSSLTPVSSPPPRPILRSMAPQLPDHLALLQVEMREVEVRREEVKVGKGLFETLMKKEKAKMKAAARAKKESDDIAQKTGWQSATVTFDPRQLASRRTSTQIERQLSAVTFDPVTSSHDNRITLSQMERRVSQVTLDPGNHDDRAPVHTEQQMSTVTFDDCLSGSHDNRTQAEQTLTSGSVAVAVDELEMNSVSGESVNGEGGGGEGEDLEEKDAKEEDRSRLFEDFVYQWYRQLCVLVWVMDGLKLDSTAQLPPFAKCWQLNRAGVHAEHSPLKMEQSYSLWMKSTAPSKCDEESPQSHLGVNRLHSRQGHMIPAGHTHPISTYRQKKREAAIREDERLRRQKKLSLVQMKELIKTVEEELNISKRANRARIQRLLQQSEVAKKKASSPSSSPPPSATTSSHHVRLDVDRYQEHFTETEQTKTMTVHHQLAAMDRDRVQALEQRLVSLKAQHSLWRDLSLMRQGVEIESTCMARKKLLMNFKWYSDLLARLPDTVKTNRYCHRLLNVLADHSQYSAVVGPDQWSKTRLINILSTLRPWELRSPETAAAIEFLIRHVIYILPGDYEEWLNYHTISHTHKNSSQNCR